MFILLCSVLFFLLFFFFLCCFFLFFLFCFSFLLRLLPECSKTAGDGLLGIFARTKKTTKEEGPGSLFIFIFPKNTFLKTKVSFLILGSFLSAETTILIVLPGFYCFGPKHFWPEQIVCTKMRVLSPFPTQMLSGNFAKTPSFTYFSFLNDHIKKH